MATDYNALGQKIKSFFKGEIFTDIKTLDTYNHDASLFLVEPSLVVFPKDSEDIQKLVKFLF